MNPTPPQSAASSPETDSTSATTDPARTALLDALNELLEAERAGARVAMETGRPITDSELAALVDDIHKDEVRWPHAVLSISVSGSDQRRLVTGSPITVGLHLAKVHVMPRHTKTGVSAGQV